MSDAVLCLCIVKYISMRKFRVTFIFVVLIFEGFYLLRTVLIFAHENQIGNFDRIGNKLIAHDLF